jgi:hypothetical protein
MKHRIDAPMGDSAWEPEPETFAEPETDLLENIVETWLRVRDIPAVAARLRAELAHEGITVETLTRAPISSVRKAVMAALQVDAQSLVAAAVRVHEEA